MAAECRHQSQGIFVAKSGFVELPDILIQKIIKQICCGCDSATSRDSAIGFDTLCTVAEFPKVNLESAHQREHGSQFLQFTIGTAVVVQQYPLDVGARAVTSHVKRDRVHSH